MRGIGRMWLYALAILLGGCAGTGKEATPDMAGRLHQAEELYEHQDQPLAAEKLIRDTMEEYRSSYDQVGLAESYRVYGFFLRSEAVEKWSKHYREQGFLDPSVSFETRYEKSIDYLEKARTIFAAYGRYDAMTNINLNIGFTYEVMGNADAACRAFERSIGDNRDSLEQHAKMKLALPKGFSTYEDFIAPHRQRVGCESRRKHPGRQRGVMSA